MAYFAASRHPINFENLLFVHALEQVTKAIVPNCAVTSYEFDPTAGKNGKLVPRLINFVAPLEEAGTPVTAEPDLPAAPKS